MDITELLAFSAKEGASDLDISAGLPLSLESMAMSFESTCRLWKLGRCTV